MATFLLGALIRTLNLLPRVQLPRDDPLQMWTLETDLWRVILKLAPMSSTETLPFAPS